MNRYVSQLDNKQEMCHMETPTGGCQTKLEKKFFDLKRPHTNIVPGPNIGLCSDKS